MDENVAKIKHSMKTSAELKLEPRNTRLRKFLKQLPRPALKKNVLYRKFFEHNGDYYLQVVVPEHLEQELMCRKHDQLQHAGMQKCIQEFRKRFYFPDIYEILRSILKTLRHVFKPNLLVFRKCRLHWNL